MIYERNGEVTDDFTCAGKITVDIVAKDDSNFTGIIKKEYEIAKKDITISAKDKDGYENSND